MLARLAPISVVVDDTVLPFQWPAISRKLSPPIVAMEKVSVGYGDRTVLSKLDLTLSNDDRIGLIGANGNGKSTFAKLVGGRMPPMGGKMIRANKLDVGFFAQHQVDDLDASGTPYTHVAERMPGAHEAKIRARVARIGFSGGRADTSIGQLSGGEKARLLMGLATFEGPQLLILDEPTNHLDIDSRGELIDAINEYEGACILISHDRRLLEACVDRLWLVADGTVRAFDGDLGGLYASGARPRRPCPSAVQVAPRRLRKSANPSSLAAISGPCARRSSPSSRRCTSSRICSGASTRRWRVPVRPRAPPRKWSASPPSARSWSARCCRRRKSGWSFRRVRRR